MPLVYIIVLNWNKYKDTITCLESLFQLDYLNYHIVICDNDSQDNSVEKICEWANDTKVSLKCIVYNSNSIECFSTNPLSPVFDSSELTLIQTGGNLGFAGGNNVGIRYALLNNECQYVWILNNDTLVMPEALSALVERSQQDSKIGICGSKLLYDDDKNKVQAWGGATYNKWTGVAKRLGCGQSLDTVVDVQFVEETIDYVVGASMLVSVKFIKEIGLMNDEYFLYYEEIDWSSRAKHRYSLAYADKSIIYHQEGGSTKSNSTTKELTRTADLHSVRSLIIYTKRHFQIGLPLIYLRLLFSVLKRFQRKQHNRAIVILMLILNHNYRFD
jgi:GT2 family glycosyltransferase